MERKCRDCVSMIKKGNTFMCVAKEKPVYENLYFQRCSYQRKPDTDIHNEESVCGKEGKWFKKDFYRR